MKHPRTSRSWEAGCNGRSPLVLPWGNPRAPAVLVQTPLPGWDRPHATLPWCSPAHPAKAPAQPASPPLHSPGGPSLPSPCHDSRSVPALPSRAGGDRVHHHPVQLHVQQQLRGRNEQEAHPHHHHPGDERVSGCRSRDGHRSPLREGWGPSGRNPPLQGAPPGGRGRGSPPQPQPVALSAS